MTQTKTDRETMQIRRQREALEHARYMAAMRMVDATTYEERVGGNDEYNRAVRGLRRLTGRNYG